MRDLDAPADDRRDADHRLAELSPGDLLEHVLVTMPGGLFTVDPEGRITSWNRGMEELSGFSAGHALGRSCSFLHGNTCFLGPLGEGQERCPLFSGDRVVGKRCSIRHADGRRVPLVKHARLMRDGTGEVVGAIEVVTDVSNVEALERQVAELRRATRGGEPIPRMVGRHPSMQRVYDMIEVAGRSPSSVLILGETGTGKELVARAIHEASERSGGPFVRVSCAALSETVLESELFGHVRGAFTGAVANRVGRFEQANGGTLFLDEIGDIPGDVQKKLLRVLQEREVERVGDNRAIPVDIRVLAATHRDLARESQIGVFRRDLYYRLAVLPIVLPPLRERRSDIPLLVEYFVDRLNRMQGRDVQGLSAQAMARLIGHGWPGNVRELAHALEYAFAVTRGAEIDAGALPLTLGRSAQPAPTRAARSTRPGRAEIERALAETGGNRTRAAKLLGVSRVTLWKWLKADEAAVASER